MKITLNTIRAAKSGDTNAIKQILAHYDDYINTLSYVDEIDLNGNAVPKFDPAIKADLQDALVLAIRKFDIERKFPS